MAQTFRTAFGGFHKEDVVRYLEYLNNKHQNQVNQLNTEIAQLRAGQEALNPDVQEEISRLEAENQQLRAQKEDLERRCAQLTAQLEKGQSAPAETGQELDAYRQAERIQKEAREQVELLYFQANHILSQTNTRLDQASGDLTRLTDEVMGQITQLQVAVSSGKQALQDASSVLSTLRPNR